MKYQIRQLVITVIVFVLVGLTVSVDKAAAVSSHFLTLCGRPRRWNESRFSDERMISSYAQEAVDWTKDRDLINGKRFLLL